MEASLFPSPPSSRKALLTEEEIRSLRERSYQVRRYVLEMATRGGCFVGAAFSCVDLLVYLYSRFLRISKELLDDPNRDYFFLSKGHAVAALYGVLAVVGLMDPRRLGNHLKPHDVIYWHPNRAVAGIEFHSGSLGHLLPVGVGVAIDCKLRRQKNRVVVLLGDGELNEGSNWEACLIAQAYRLDNLILVVDRNGFQANARTEALIPLDPLEKKFQAFGLSETTIDGHNFVEMERVFAEIPFDPGMPNVVIAETVRGKGVLRLEERVDRWFCQFTPEEAEGFLEELER
ncbi:MAG: thiamine pyrophosphate-dependent enzyme [Desulfobacterota bacterium]|nr:thiamine pyrophosphate-dependent enzyme [Thermodesulfobacteriota bacterium]